jgi:predicted KAP-like P-loop ATPase
MHVHVCERELGCHLIKAVYNHYCSALMLRLQVWQITFPEDKAFWAAKAQEAQAAGAAVYSMVSVLWGRPLASKLCTWITIRLGRIKLRRGGLSLKGT